MNIEVLINKYYKLIYKICFNMLSNTDDAEDATQEVYILIYKNIHRYSDLTENELKNVICMITLNKCRDILRKSKTNDIIIECEDEELARYPDSIDIEEALAKKERKFEIEKMVNELKKPYKDILHKYYIEEKSLDEVANEMNIEKATLKVQIYRAKKFLKKIIIEKGGDELL